MSGRGLKNLRHLVTTLFCLLAVPAMAEELIVVSFKGKIPGLKDGLVLLPGDTVNLPAASSVRLLSASGKVVSIEGPYSGSVAAAEENKAAPGSQPGVARLAKFLTERQMTSQALGTMRSASDKPSQKQPKDPWQIVFGENGAQCARLPKVEIWRRDNRAKDTLTLRSRDGITAKFLWPAGENSIEMTREFTLDGETVEASMGKKKHSIAVHLLPMELDNPFEIANWLIEKDCTRQAEIYLSQIQ
ncbi:MAG: hypothetical protein EPN26_14810 [Rhodospirillales bacterium]|nr:MAG: hypothetical protein EPN26_14810 [Rhodospirillales bacterium]